MDKVGENARPSRRPARDRGSSTSVVVWMQNELIWASVLWPFGSGLGFVVERARAGRGLPLAAAGAMVRPLLRGEGGPAAGKLLRQVNRGLLQSCIRVVSGIVGGQRRRDDGQPVGGLGDDTCHIAGR